MRKVIQLYLLLTCVFIGLRTSAQVSFQASDKHISYMGRVLKTKDSTVLYWPGTSASINYVGSSIKVTMKSLREKGYFYAIVDGDISKAIKFGSDSLKRTFTFAKDVTPGPHTLQLYKTSNSTSANVIYSFEIESNGKLTKPAALPKRKIEFYGNSITAGHSVDPVDAGRPAGSPEFFNNYYSYAALTSRHFNAQQSIVARSGIGIMLSWFPEIMPEIYNRIDPMDPKSTWNFNSFKPDIVVVNLFQNDYWLVNSPTHAQFKARFGTAKPTEDFIINSYYNFIKNIRRVYPKARIICALGNMNATEDGSKWPGYIQQAVAKTKDANIYTLFFPYKKTDGHPNRAEQQIMADQLIKFIETNIRW
ncbi:GDSL-type esterase/lipase family protein [Pedobacter frigoris]|uniref:SGNH/GDSL hydrolase family protein n=1 Tax=Pedobacter frigoris TaxID=2571272 RepID=UPI002931DB54|nr:GDSL-type esterase/lipase family protein [Pedobacter frigoris]